MDMLTLPGTELTLEDLDMAGGVYIPFPFPVPIPFPFPLPFPGPWLLG